MPPSKLADIHVVSKKPRISPPHFESGTTIGQFSFVPTTQTTVVTTTTTTTTSFPPLVLRPPRNLSILDPKDYPLAASPTPEGLKRLCFDVNGQPTQFTETDDPAEAYNENLVGKLQDGQGSVRSVDHGIVQCESPSMSTSGVSQERKASLCGSTRKRPASPVSMIENGDRTPVNHKSTKRRLITARPTLDSIGGRLMRRRSKENQIETPSSSQTDFSANSTTYAPRPIRPTLPLFSQTQHNVSSEVNVQSAQPMQQQHDTSHALSPSKMVPFTPTERDAPLLPPVLASSSKDDDNGSVILVASDSPESQGDQMVVQATRASSEGSVNPPSTQPLSLPSPSLSPVTAAMTHPDYFTSIDSDDETFDSSFEISRNDGDMVMTDADFEGPPTRGQRQFSGISASSVMQLPQMVDTFDALPQALKSYLMYQFLRRCDKNTLQFVAEVVNPALKCDFLSRLPAELSLNIIKYLDYKSLTNAAQVSKKWRILIDSDEWTWKKLFESDGYTLSEGELERAVREGWGYQDPEGYLDCEKDIQVNLANGLPQGAGNISFPSKKRKNTRLSAKKAQKQRQTVESLGKDEFKELITNLSNNEGFSAAVHAASSNPPPSVGLPSLTNLHLYKSIYRRHHIIRKSWIRPDIRPRHISFRGHQRHVVTCLQFDTDKILTGSDDTNINVYDTNNGALLNKLEGHEGGVWALQYHGNTLVSGSTDRTVRVWDIEKGECTQVFHGHTSTVRCLQILLPTKVDMKDGKAVMMPRQPLIITGSRDSNLKVWRLPAKGDKPYLPPGAGDSDPVPPNPYYVKTLIGHTHSVRAIAAHADTLVSGSYDNFVRVWKISTGECLHRLAGHTAKVYSVVLDSKRNRCISGSMDSCVKVWSLDTGSLLYTLEGHTSLVGLLDLSHDHLVSAAADASLRIWDPETGKLRHTLSAHTGAITCFQHDGHKVISGSDGTLKMWDVKTGQFIRDLLTNLSGVWQVRFNERRCVAAVQRDNVTFIEVLDFGAARDGVPEDQRGRRIVVNARGEEIDPNEVLNDDPPPQ